MTISEIHDYIEEHRLDYLGACPNESLPTGRKPKHRRLGKEPPCSRAIAIYCREGHFLSLNAKKNAMRIHKDGETTNWSSVEGNVSELLQAQGRSGNAGLGAVLEPDLKSLIHFSS